MSTTQPSPRPGGRSARIQGAVHAAVRELQDEQGRAQLTVPVIAQRAGVTPSTIYRRWGDLQELLADVAVELLRPDSEPEDTGSLLGDLIAWTEQYLEEMASPHGRTFTCDVLAAGAAVGRPGRCAGYTRDQIELVLDRARLRGEPAPNPDAVIDHVVAPLIYRILFDTQPPTHRQARGLVADLLARQDVPAVAG
ncbi:MAG: TetR/AcrR family transcriptional regulator [Jatrophihabitans sp.]